MVGQFNQRRYIIDSDHIRSVRYIKSDVYIEDEFKCSYRQLLKQALSTKEKAMSSHIEDKMRIKFLESCN